MERQRNLPMSSKTQLAKDHVIAGGGTNTTRSSSSSLYKVKDISPSWNYSTTATASTGGDHSLPHHQQDYLTAGFSWPPRSYTCSFCKREFRSAQALGGHMNVHRRDRARLRQSPPLPPTLDHHNNYPILNLNNPNPNPNTTNFSSPPSLGQLVSSPSSLSPATALGRHEASRRSSLAPIEGRVLDHHPPEGRVVIPDHLSKVGTRKSLFGGGGGGEYSSSTWCDHHGLTMGQRDGANKFRKRAGDRFHNNVSLELEIGVITESTSKNHHHHHRHHEQQLDLELRLGI